MRGAHSSCAPNNIHQNKMCHLKNLPVKGLCGRCLSEFKDWRCWYFRPSFVNCCPSPLLSGSTLSPIHPFPVWISVHTVKTYTVCKGGRVRGYGPLRVNFFRWQHFALPSMSLLFLRRREMVDMDPTECQTLFGAATGSSSQRTSSKLI